MRLLGDTTAAPLAALIAFVLSVLAAERSAAWISSRVETAARGAVLAAGQDWASVDAAGQIVLLSGPAPSAASREAAIAAARSAIGQGGGFWGGVTRVDPAGVWVVKRKDTTTDSVARTDEAKPIDTAAQTGVEASRDAAEPTRLQPPTAAAQPPQRLPAAEARPIASPPPSTGVDRDVNVIAQPSAAARSSPLETNAAPEAASIEIAELDPRPAETTSNEAPPLDAMSDEDTTAPQPAPEPAPEPSNAVVRAAGCQSDLDSALTGLHVAFASAASNVGRGAARALTDVASVLEQCGRVLVEVQGHTDTSGDATKNLSLSRRRAESVVAFLAGLGVGDAALIAQGLGGSQPIASNESAEGRALNRRIEFIVRPLD